MHLMLQQQAPADYVIATGETHSVREFVELAFETAGMPIHWDVERPRGPQDRRPEQQRVVGVSERGVVVRQSEKFFRPAEVDVLVGDPGKAERELGWKPAVRFRELVRIMVESDLRSVGQGLPG
jgi:GDPmannose 4,6-dehydratase